MQFYKKFIHSYFSWMGDICDAIQNANNIGILASCIEMQRFMIFYVEYLFSEILLLAFYGVFWLKSVVSLLFAK